MNRNTDTEVTMNGSPITRPASATAADDAARLAATWTNQQAKRQRDEAIQARCGDLTTVAMVAS